MTSLPDHLITERILPRLPVKSLHRFKSVSKSWFSEITSEEFAKTHLEFSSVRSRYLGLDLYDFNNESSFLLSFNLESNSNGMLVNFQSDITPERGGHVVGCCHGIVCLRYVKDNFNYFSIWNPVTGQHCKTSFGKSQILRWGFSYVSSMDDYKIFLLAYCEREANIRRVFMFSATSGEWKMVGVERQYIPSSFNPNDKSILVGENLHWAPHSVIRMFFSFNFSSEKLVVKPSMQWLQAYGSVELVNVEGCLSCSCRNNNACHAIGVYDVWMLKRYNDWDSWEKLFSVDYGGVPLFCLGDIDSTILVYHHDSKQVTVVNLTRDGLQKFHGGVDLSGRTYIADPLTRWKLGVWRCVERLDRPLGVVK